MKKLYTFITTLFILLSSAATAQTVDGRDFSIDGFAAYAGTPGTAWYHAGGTTGGAGGKVVYADTFSELQAYLQSSEPYVILVNHDITTGIPCYVDDLSTGHLLDDQSGSTGVKTTYGERILIASNKTLIGIVDPATGKAPLFSRITFVMQCTHNVIIRNCRFTMVGAPILKSGENKIVAWRNGAQVEVGDPDCIGIQADAVSASKDSGSHIWIDHCEFFNGGAANKDRYDGLLDCKNNVQWLTFSYNHFHNHDKSCLWGKGDSDVYEGCRTISAHHNYFQNIDGSRLPLQRGGNVHYMNNMQEGCSDGWDLRSKSVGFAEACYFKNSKAPILPDGGGQVNISQEEGYGIIYDNCQRVIKGTSNISYVNEPAKYDAEFNLASLNAVSTWVPTQTVSSYFVNNRDKVTDLPDVISKYTGAGKIEIWQTYTNDVPSTDVAELAKAIETAKTGKTYDASGNELKVIDGKVKLSPSAAITLSANSVTLTDENPSQDVTITVNATDADGTIAAIALTINGTEVKNVSNSPTLTYTLTCSEETTYAIDCTVTDNDGLTTTKSATLAVKKSGNTPGGGGETGDIPTDGKVLLQSDNVPKGFALDGSATVEPYVYSSDLCRDANLIKVVSGTHTVTIPANMKVTAITMYAVGDNNTANKGKITSLAGETFSESLPSRKEGTAFATATVTGVDITGSFTFNVTYASGVKFALTVEDLTPAKSIKANGSATPATIYTLDGRIMPANAQLPRGIYVIGNKKISVK